MAPNESGKEELGNSQRPGLGLPQRIADCDPATKEKIRLKVKNDIFANPEPMMPYVFFNMCPFSFLLPEHWGLQPADFVRGLEIALVDLHIMEYFTTNKIINWSNATSKLFPLRTTGDGNCLMHAISLFLWGIEDLDLQMRRVLYQDIFSDNAAKKYKKRWQLGRAAFDQGIPSAGLRYDTMNWDDEWKLVIRNSSPEPNTEGQHVLPYHSLEEIHVFIMANVLRRPIIVLADTMFRDTAGRSLQPQNVTGIYLPVLSKPENCCHYPIVLGYHQNHFVPLVGKKLSPTEDLEMALPMCSNKFEGFPVHFLLPDEEQSRQRLLESYLRQKPLAQSRGAHTTMLSIPAAVLGTDEFPESVSIMKTYFKLAEKNYQTGFRAGAAKAFGAPPSDLQMSQSGKTSGVKICCMCNTNQADGDNDVCRECLMKNCTSFHPSASAPPASMPLSAVTNEFGMLSLERNRIDPEAELRGPPQNPFPTGLNRHQLSEQGYSICVEKPCKTPGCQFYCSSQLRGDYCHTCSKNVPSIGKAPSIGHHAGIEKCRTEGCWIPANPERQGLCDVCSGTHHLKKQLSPQVVGYDPAPSTRMPTSGYRSSYQGRTNILDDPSGLDSLAISQSNIGSKKCQEPSCKLTGQDALHGFCNKCYGKHMQTHKRVENVPQGQSTNALKQGSMEGVKAVTGHLSGVSRPQLSAVAFQASSAQSKCKTEKCDLFGTQQQNGYCTKCLEEILLKEIETKNVCKSMWCSRKVFQDDYCIECFEHAPKLTGHPSEVPLQSAAMSGIGQRSGTSLVNTCISNGCDGLVVILGDGRHCYDCHQSSRGQASIQQLMKCVNSKCGQQTPKDQPLCKTCQSVLDANKSEQALKANTMSPAPSTVLKIPCINGCGSFAGSDNLCNECRHTKKTLALEDMYNVGLAKKEEFIRSQEPTCRSQGCQMYGTAKHQGYCSKCYNIKTTKRECKSEQIKLSPKMLEEEPPYKARRCVKGCGNWANVQVLDGLCNNCFELYKNESPRRIAQSARVAETNAAPGQELKRNKNRTDQNCFNPDCSNRGNPKSQGFCNSCYRKLNAK